MIVRDAQPADQARVFVRATALKNTWHEATAHVGPDGLRWRFDANVWIGARPEDEWRYATEPADVDDLFDPMFIKNETHSRLPPFERNTERRTVPYEDHAALEAEVERLKARGPDPEDVLAVCRVAEYAAIRWGTKPDELVDLKVLLARIRNALEGATP